MKNNEDNPYDEKIDKMFIDNRRKSHGCIITIIVFLMIYVIAIIVCNEKINILREVLITTGFAAIITVLDRIVQLKREEFEHKREQNLFICKQINSIKNEELKVGLLREIIKE